LPSYRAPVQVRNVMERNSGTAVPDETALRNSAMVKWQRLAERLGADALEDHEFLMEEQSVVQGWSAVFAAKSTVTLVNRFYKLDRPVMCARLHQLPWPPITGEILQFFRTYSEPTSPRSTSTSKRNRGTAVPDESALRRSVLLKWQRLAERLGADALEDHELHLGEQPVVKSCLPGFAARHTVTLVKRLYELGRLVVTVWRHQMERLPTIATRLPFFRTLSSPMICHP
jgi:hypothetical protein